MGIDPLQVVLNRRPPLPAAVVEEQARVFVG
jgi:hypothetical protein